LKDKKGFETKVDSLNFFWRFNSEVLKEAKHFFKSNNNKYRMRNGRENWESEFNNLVQKWKILLIDSTG
jgi:hypothetical protein